MRLSACVAILAIPLAGSGCGPKVMPASAADALPAPSDQGAATAESELDPESESEPEPESPAKCPSQPGLCFSVSPAAAELNVDGRDLGAVSTLGVPGAAYLQVNSGIHQITLRHRGYETWRGEVAVGEGLERIEVRLNPKK